MSEPLLVRSERVVSPRGVGPAALWIQDGVIQEVEAEVTPATECYLELDVGDLAVLPGGVDVHTHMDMVVGGVHTADDWASGSRAALFGGTTTVVDFAEPGPSGSLLEGLRQAEELFARGSVVDAGLHMTVTRATDAVLEEMDAVVAAGQTTFKVYTAYPALMLDAAGLGRVFARAAALGARVWVHCEQWDPIAARIDAARVAGRLSAREHARSRPPETEVRAVEQVIELAGRTGAHVHLAHLSTAGAVSLLAKARAAGLPVTAETCPHYLWLEEHRLGWDAPAGLCHICAPPLRTAPHLEAVWQGVASGDIEAVATDHCPFSWRGGKDRGLVDGQEDFTRTPGGLPGVESRLPLVFSGGVVAGRFDLGTFAERVATGPARLAGLYPRKGVIAPGADADLVIWDPEGATCLDGGALHSRVDHSPYEGMWAQGQVVAVLRAGQVVVSNGEWTGQAQPGRILRRARVGEDVARATEQASGTGNGAVSQKREEIER